MPTRSTTSHALISAAQIEAEALPYYHPQLKNLSQVVQVMDWCRDIHGSFLLRDSSRTPGLLAVSVWYKKNGCESRLKHFNIKCHNISYYLEEDLFPTIEKLINFYATNDVPNEEGIEGVRLVFPITDIVVEESGDIRDTRVDPFVVTVQDHHRTSENRTETTYEPPRGSIPAKQTKDTQSRMGATNSTRSIPLPPVDSDDENYYSYCGLTNDTVVPVSCKPEVPSQHRPPKPSFSANRLSSGSSSSSSMAGSDSAFDTDDDTVLIPTRKSKDKKKFTLFRKTENQGALHRQNDMRL